MDESILKIISSWPAPNYTNPVTRGSEFITANLLLLALVILTVSLRIYTRLSVSRYFGSDDILISLATLSTGVFNTLSMIVALKYDSDRHVWDVPFPTFTTGRALSLPTQVMFALSTTLTKCSALVFFSRLKGAGRDWICVAAIGLCAAQGTVFSFMDIFQCTPIKAFWDFTVADRKCLSEELNLLIWSVANTITDFLVVLLPLSIFWKMRMPRRQRIIVCTLFGVGGIACVAGIVRIIYTLSVVKFMDTTWQAEPLWLVNSIELDLGIICTSAPSLKPLVSRYFPKAFKEYTPEVVSGFSSDV